MKKHVVIAASMLATLLSACSAEKGNKEKFLGNWQSIKSPERPKMLIEQQGENLVVTEGKNIEPATYDKENQKIVINLPIGALDVIYLADKDHLLISQGGEYSRVK